MLSYAHDTIFFTCMHYWKAQSDTNFRFPPPAAYTSDSKCFHSHDWNWFRPHTTETLSHIHKWKLSQYTWNVNLFHSRHDDTQWGSKSISFYEQSRSAFCDPMNSPVECYPPKMVSGKIQSASDVTRKRLLHFCNAFTQSNKILSHTLTPKKWFTIICPLAHPRAHVALPAMYCKAFVLSWHRLAEEMSTSAKARRSDWLLHVEMSEEKNKTKTNKS